MNGVGLVFDFAFSFQIEMSAKVNRRTVAIAMQHAKTPLAPTNVFVRMVFLGTEKQLVVRWVRIHNDTQHLFLNPFVTLQDTSRFYFKFSHRKLGTRYHIFVIYSYRRRLHQLQVVDRS